MTGILPMPSLTWSLWNDVYAVLVPGFVYRAYVTPRSGRLLAVELAP